MSSSNKLFEINCLLNSKKLSNWLHPYRRRSPVVPFGSKSFFVPSEIYYIPSKMALPRVYFDMTANNAPSAASSWNSVTTLCPRPCPLHRREGIRLQEIHIPPSHPQLHVPGWRLHKPQRHWRKVNLWSQVRRWELPAEAHRTRNLEHGQHWTQHQRLPVLCVHRQDLLVGRLARRLWLSCRRHGCRQKD